MPASEQRQGELAHVCDVCEIELLHVEKPVSAEYHGLVLTFCQPECYKRYLEDPEKYAKFDKKPE